MALALNTSIWGARITCMRWNKFAKPGQWRPNKYPRWKGNWKSDPASIHTTPRQMRNLQAQLFRAPGWKHRPSRVLCFAVDVANIRCYFDSKWIDNKRQSITLSTSIILFAGEASVSRKYFAWKTRYLHAWWDRSRRFHRCEALSRSNSREN